MKQAIYTILIVAASTSAGLLSGKASADTAILWNKLDSDIEAVNSNIGPSGTLIKGSPQIRYIPVKFGNGAHVDGDSNVARKSVIEYDPGAASSTLADRGSVEFWVKPDHDSNFGDIARWLGGPSMPPNTLGVGLYWRGWESTIWFQLCTSSAGCTLDLVASVPSSQFAFSSGEVFHVAMAWDRAGIDGTNDTMRAYINGIQYARVTRSWEPNLRLSTLKLGDMDYPQHAAVDNLIVWDYAKTDYSSRFNENPVGQLFFTFSPRAEFTLGPKANDDSYWVRGWLKLADTSNGINPLAEAVTIKVGPFSHTLPAGSFARESDSYVFKGSVGASVLDVRITASSTPGGYSFKSCLKKADLEATTLKPDVQLTIGDDSGQATLGVGYAKFGKGSNGKSWVFPSAQ